MSFANPVSAPEARLEHADLVEEQVQAAEHHDCTDRQSAIEGQLAMIVRVRVVPSATWADPAPSLPERPVVRETRTTERSDGMLAEAARTEQRIRGRASLTGRGGGRHAPVIDALPKHLEGAVPRPCRGAPRNPFWVALGTQVRIPFRVARETLHAAGSRVDP